MPNPINKVRKLNKEHRKNVKFAAKSRPKQFMTTVIKGRVDSKKAIKRKERAKRLTEKETKGDDTFMQEAEESDSDTEQPLFTPQRTGKGTTIGAPN